MLYRRLGHVLTSFSRYPICSYGLTSVDLRSVNLASLMTSASQTRRGMRQMWSRFCIVQRTTYGPNFEHFPVRCTLTERIRRAQTCRATTQEKASASSRMQATKASSWVPHSTAMIDDRKYFCGAFRYRLQPRGCRCPPPARVSRRVASSVSSRRRKFARLLSAVSVTSSHNVVNRSR